MKVDHTIGVWLSCVCLQLIAATSVSAQAVIYTDHPLPFRFAAAVSGSITSIDEFGIGAAPSGGGAALNIKFKYNTVLPGSPSTPNFIVVTPDSGTTPARISIGLNESVIRQMTPGIYTLQLVFTTIDQSPPDSTGVVVMLNLDYGPRPTIQSVVSSASYQPIVSPGGMVSIFGVNFKQPAASAPYDLFGMYPTDFMKTKVTFDGMAAPLLYVGPNQINAVVPYGVSGKKSTQVVVTLFGNYASSAFPVSVVDTSPAIFTATQNGTGQGAILNVPTNPNDLSGFSFNSASNPAPKGSVVEMFATGIGVLSPAVQDGAISLSVKNFTAQPVSLTIGGQPARIYYAGTSPYQLWGMLQITAFVPNTIESGQQPVVLKIGELENSLQKVTIAVQ